MPSDPNKLSHLEWTAKNINAEKMLKIIYLIVYGIV